MVNTEQAYKLCFIKCPSTTWVLFYYSTSIVFKKQFIGYTENPSTVFHKQGIILDQYGWTSELPDV